MISMRNLIDAIIFAAVLCRFEYYSKTKYHNFAKIHASRKLYTVALIMISIFNYIVNIDQL